MTPDKFDYILNRILEHCQGVLGAKAFEYADNKDRLHNFKIAADVTNGTPETALWGFLVKHLVSIMDMVEDSRTGICHDDEKWDEKIGDAINYLILLKALTVERNHNAYSNMVPDRPRTFADKYDPDNLYD